MNKSNLTEGYTICNGLGKNNVKFKVRNDSTYKIWKHYINECDSNQFKVDPRYYLFSDFYDKFEASVKAKKAIVTNLVQDVNKVLGFCNQEYKSIMQMPSDLIRRDGSAFKVLDLTSPESQKWSSVGTLTSARSVLDEGLTSLKSKDIIDKALLESLHTRAATSEVVDPVVNIEPITKKAPVVQTEPKDEESFEIKIVSLITSGIDAGRFKIIARDGKEHITTPAISTVKGGGTYRTKTLLRNGIPGGVPHYHVDRNVWNGTRFRLLPSEVAAMDNGKEFNNFYAKKLGIPIVVSSPCDVLQPRDYAPNDITSSDEHVVEKRSMFRKAVDFFKAWL